MSAIRSATRLSSSASALIGRSSRSTSSSSSLLNCSALHANTLSSSAVPRHALNNNTNSLRSFSAAAAAAAAAAQPATANSTKKPDMFCFQCEQTENNTACTKVGVCGKTPDVAALQDMLVYCCKGISMYATRANDLGVMLPEVNHFLLDAMFSTLTNVNFDGEAIAEYIRKAENMRDKIQNAYEKACASKNMTPERLGGPAAFVLASKDTESLRMAGEQQGIFARREALGADIVGLQEMVVYGVKGTCAYAEHAFRVGKESNEVFASLYKCMDAISKDNPTVDELLAAAMKVGETNLMVMGLLDSGHTTQFGHPEPTKVPCKPKPGKAILVSGHDLHDLNVLLEQTAGKGINVYTHGEMLPAHAYPGLKKYPHLAGHYGGPWQLQKFEFSQFPGAIMMTTNCLVEPQKKYKDRLFTCSVTGWPGVKHISGSDYSAIINKALESDGFEQDDCDSIPESFLTTGFGHNAVMSVADKVVAAVKSGAIKNFFVVGGCDGSESERSYFTDFAKSAPKDSVILTLGCGKYRFNRLDLGNIGGIPRVLDMGQCNDAFSAIQVAVALANVFKTDVNGLPLGFAVSWFEQKAVAVLLTLLHLGIRNIRLGPRVPGFATPNMVSILQQKFNLGPIGSATEDLNKMINRSF